MFKPYKGGSIEIIQGIECHIPKAGYIFNPLTNKEEYIGIYKRAIGSEYQYWERDKDLALTPDWDKECKRNGLKPEEHLEYIKRIEKWWKYRLGGFWFYNKGVPTYITGANWYYLSVYNLDIGAPKYRDIDRQYFYIWKWVQENPKCYGLVEITKRRCFGLGTKVIMYDGTSKEVQDIVVGDRVMGDDSTIRNVLSTTSGIDNMYKVIPNFGEPFVCNEIHTLCLFWNSSSKNTKHGWEAKSYITIQLDEYLKLKKWEKEHLVMYIRGWGEHFESKEHKIPPYILGAWIGDGTRVNGHMSIADVEIKNAFQEYCDTHDLDLIYSKDYAYRINKNSKGHVTAIVDGVLKYFDTLREMAKYIGLSEHFKYTETHWAVEKYQIKKLKDEHNPHRRWLSEIGVLENKHIPQEYLIDSTENRLELLAGIVDTDGYLSNNTYYEVTQKSEVMANDIRQLARSLGFMVTINEKIARMKREDGSVYECLVYRTNICGDIWRIPCKVARKKAQIRDLKVDRRNTGFKVEQLGKDYFYGFELDSNHKFVLHNSFVVSNSGKSFRAGAISLEESSRRDNFMVGIQSKTDIDAEKFFKKNIINPFRKMPLCFRPNTNLPTSGKAPMSELKFENPKIDSYDDELMSAIDYQSSTIGAYDGQKLGLYVADEFGKLVGVSVNDRWDIVKFCLRDEEGNIIGKTIHTSTVEKERLKSGKTKSDDDTCDKNALELWNKSNQEKLGEDGTTESGLVRFFIGGDYTRYLDKYGFADRVKGYNAIMAERAKLKDNPRALANLIRKEPLTDREAFQADGDTCIFGNPVIIQTRFDDLSFLPIQYKIGNFHWVDGKKDGDVYFEECDGGRFWLAYDPPEEQRNRIKERSYSDVPDNKEYFCAGIDPFEYKIVQNGSTRGLSKGSLCIVKKEDSLKPTMFDNGVACLYLHRPPLPETFYEDCIKALKYFGCEALIERNKGDIIKHMKERGYEEFVAWLPDQPERGIYNSSRESGGGVNGMITEVIDQWIGSGVDNIVFKELLEQLLIFDPTNTTKFDAVMAYGYALLLYKNTIRQQNKKNRRNYAESPDVTGWFK